MPLPSQSSRGGSGIGPGGGSRGFVYKRKRRGGSRVPVPVRWVGSALAFAAAIWLAWSLMTSGQVDSEGEPRQDPAPRQGAGGEAQSRAPGLDAPSRPLVIDQGTGTSTNTSTARTARVPDGGVSPTQGAGLLGNALREPSNTANRGTGPGGTGNTTGQRPEGTRGQSASPAPATTLPSVEVSRLARAAISDAKDRLSANDPLGARATLNAALSTVGRDGPDAGALRAELMALNDDLVFGPRIVKGDPIVEAYVVQSGDALSRIASREKLMTHWKLIQRVNRLSSPNTIRVGQSLKLVRGPFHAIVDKSDYRLDLYHGPASQPSLWTYVTSFPVGLGEDDSTPAGRFVVRMNSKLENPAWVNPRNPSERYAADDPKNPIGEFWVGIDGLGDDAVHTGLGLHGTIEPESIGRQMSMGCVRLGADDVAIVYEMLAEGESLVTIVE